MGLRSALAAAFGRAQTPTGWDGAGFGEKALVNSVLAVPGLTADAASGRMRDYSSYLGAIFIPNVFSAVNLIATNFSSARLRILDGDDVEVDVKRDLPRLHQLLRRPNPLMKGKEFRQAMAYDMCLTGNSLKALDDWNGFGEPTQWIRFSPDRIRIAQLPSGALKYAYDVGGAGAADPRTVWYDQDEIVHDRYFNPKSGLWGLGYVEAGEQSLSADRLMNEFRVNYFNSGAILKGVLSTDMQLSKEQYELMELRWRALHEGARNQLKIAVLSQGAKYQPIAEPMGNIPIVSLMEASRNQVLQIFGVPPQLLGDFSDTNYRNAQEARAYFWSQTMAPLLDQMEEGYTQVVEHFDRDERGLHAAFEKREIIDYDTRSQTALRNAQSGAFTVNKILVSAGFDPLDDDDPTGDLYVVPVNMALIPADQMGQPLPQVEVGAIPAQVGDSDAGVDEPTGTVPPSDVEAVPRQGIFQHVGNPTATAAAVAAGQIPQGMPGTGGKARTRRPQSYPAELLSERFKRERARVQDRERGQQWRATPRAPTVDEIDEGDAVNE